VPRKTKASTESTALLLNYFLWFVGWLCNKATPKRKDVL
jgi:hypothetical protein